MSHSQKAALLDLTLGFLVVSSSVNRHDQTNNNTNNNQNRNINHNHNDNSLSSQQSLCSDEAVSFWRRVGVFQPSSAHHNSSSNNVEQIFAILKVIEHLLLRVQDSNSLHNVDNENDNNDSQNNHNNSSNNNNNGAVTTQRDIYYSFVEMLPRRDQTIVNRAIEAVARFTDVPRHGLGVYASTRGFIAGCVTIGAVDLRSLSGGASSQGMPIPGEFAALPEVAAEAGGGAAGASSSPPAIPVINTGGARAILIVEKDSVFQLLVGARIWERGFPLIVVTGRGFADVASRVLVARLAVWLRLPVFGLADYNPAGARILFVYRFGSSSSSSSSSVSNSSSSSSSYVACSCPTLRWLGARSDDLDLIAPAALSPLTQRDLSLTRGLLKDFEAVEKHAMKRKNKSDEENATEAESPSSAALMLLWKREVELMVRGGKRFDLEAIQQRTDLCDLVLHKLLADDAV